MNSGSTRYSKKDAKIQKGFKKQQQTIYTKKQVEYQLRNLEEQKFDSQAHDPILKRAMRWWQKIDQRFFRTLTIQQAISKRELYTSNEMLSHNHNHDNQISYLDNYKQEIFTSTFLHSFTDKNKIRVLFKSGQSHHHHHQSAIVVYGIQPSIANYHSDNTQDIDEWNIKMMRRSKKQQKMDQKEYVDANVYNYVHESKSIRLDLQEYQMNEPPLYICDRLLKIEQIQSTNEYQSQVDKQIAFWQWQLNKTNHENCHNWNILIKNMQQRKQALFVSQVNRYSSQIQKYRDKMFWGIVVRSFEHGFRDKTKKMFQTYIENQKNFNLRPPKGLVGHSNKKFFQTDCKICFSSDNTDSNQVLYCDGCNTSFHLLCYGLTSIPQQQTYFCDRCAYIQSISTSLVKYKKPYCQICLKTNFPMKRLDDHFYHVTCLILFNFVEFRQNTMALKGSLTHQNIIKMVIQNQIIHEQCNQCRKVGGGTQLGMQIKCCYNGCNNFVHPICGYLYGYKFELNPNYNRNLQIKMFCNDHLGSRAEQVYLRRYMCNLNDTSLKSYEQFKSIYESEQQGMQNIKQTIVKNKKKYPNRILMVTKFIRGLLKSRIEKDDQQQQIKTQTQKFLKKLKNKNLNNNGV